MAACVGTPCVTDITQMPGLGCVPVAGGALVVTNGDRTECQ